jgi:hypothetical protein
LCQQQDAFSKKMPRMCQSTGRLLWHVSVVSDIQIASCLKVIQ